MHTSSEKELILSTKPFAKEIRWKSWYYTLSTTVLLIASLTGSFLLPGILIKLAFSIFSALLLSRMFIIFHDFQHHTILNKSFAANILFTIFGAYMITPPSIWKRSHDHHHNNNAKLYSASIGSYPIMTKQKFYAANKKEQSIYLAIRHPLNMFFSYFTMFMFGMCVRSFLSSKKRHWDSAIVLLIHVGIAIVLWVHFGWQIWFFVFFLPFFLSHMLGAYLFYAQHNFPGATYRCNTEWSYAAAALESSSYMKMSTLWQWFTANIGYHHIHHLNCKIPFYRLPEAMAHIPALQQATVTSLRPKDIIACLRLKVWDPDLNKMVPLDS
ncbi:MAG: fatty acid desaturase [Hydrotalea flava]|uniref:fatty acid desaturase family protein n=1 Tax=Hydrotalea TaxID=1004300 RepID=UPI00094473DD|nr:MULTISPECIES: fatty acid desaturase [Hydrotalea]MBY0348899.1 fatty acid desaturase [Hydrotalea flava]NIM35981.1 fatty acid desaturase [Hydrotalea flava]NIM38814.1 fatty acid desaturase [Hydrotalea flava]NIN04018.1 fatty acid desaturase [Hydrotalea flava]NIN15723.1 fatty acid desaturase [Hydrotalea flava]